MSIFGKAAAALATSRRENAVQRQQNAVLERQWALADAARAQQDEDRKRRQQTEDVGLFRTLMTDPTLSGQLGGAPTAGTAPAMAGAGAAGAAMGAIAPAIGTSPVFAAAQSALADQVTRRQSAAPALADVAARTGATFQGSVADQRLQTHRTLDRLAPGQYGAFDPNVDYVAVLDEERQVQAKKQRILASGYTKDAARAETLARDGIDIEKLTADREDRAEQLRLQRYNAETQRRGVDQRPLLAGMGAGGMPKLTEAQAKATGHYASAAAAAGDIDSVMSRMGTVNPTTKAVGKIPVLGNIALGTFAPDLQALNLAGERFKEAYLRYASGAAISQAETEGFLRQALPQPGDTPETALARKQARDTWVIAMKIASGAGAAYIDQEMARPHDGDTGNIDLRGGAAPWADVPGFEPPPGGF